MKDWDTQMEVSFLPPYFYQENHTAEQQGELTLAFSHGHKAYG